MVKKSPFKSAQRGTKLEDSVRLGSKQPDAFEKQKNAVTSGCSVKPAKMRRLPVYTHEVSRIDPIGIDPLALSLLKETFPDWLPLTLRNELIESLRGFESHAALWIAESLWDCYGGLALATTGIAHIDAMLWDLYQKILKSARSYGVKIANHL